jgi:hypothetical protein
LRFAADLGMELGFRSDVIAGLVRAIQHAAAFDLNTDASGIRDLPLSRTMTAESVARS